MTETSAPTGDTAHAMAQERVERAREVRLSDGRALAYAEWGVEDGQAVVFFQGNPGGRLTRWWDDRLPTERGVRLLTVDRPGIGRSDRKRGRAVGDWPADVAELADHVALDRFAVIGFSTGGPYALACASRLPERVTSIALVSSLGKADHPGVTDEMATARFQRLARRVPRAMALIYSAVARKGRKDPEAAHERIFRGASSVDRAVLDRPEVRSGWMSAFVDSAQRGGYGLAEDMRVVQRAWHFDPAAIGVRVLLWHGLRDRIVPPSHAEYWVEALPGCEVVWCPDEGHFLIRDHFEEILDAVLSE
jgi:pimeloyl-ACP methyl ester carboxylesterase